MKRVSALWEALSDRSESSDHLYTEFMQKKNFDKPATVNNTIDFLVAKNNYIPSILNTVKMTDLYYNFNIHGLYSIKDKGKMLGFMITESCVFNSDSKNYKVVWIHKVAYEHPDYVPELFKSIQNHLNTFAKGENLAIILTTSKQDVVNTFKNQTGWNTNSKLFNQYANCFKDIFNNGNIDNKSVTTAFFSINNT
jgi:hypothetical protein